MSDLKESCAIYLHMASQQLIDSDDGTIGAFCHYADDVSLFEDMLQRYSTEHFREAAAAAAPTPTQTGRSHAAVIIVQEDLQEWLWNLLCNLLTRNKFVNDYYHVPWSVDGYNTVARLATSILSNIDKHWIDCVDDDATGCTVLGQAAEHGHTSVVELLLVDPRVDKASIDHASEEGFTALMASAFKGHTAIVELLLACPSSGQGFR
jgi:Ankyrin repeats (3 copies)